MCERDTSHPSVVLPRKSPSPATLLRTVAKAFGEQQYWQNFYKESDEIFSWYATWSDLEPFINEFAPPEKSDCRILLPGVGSDCLLRDLYEAGYTNIAAFDYASESVEYCRTVMLNEDQAKEIDLQVADARDLSTYATESFDLVLDKGTLDAVYLSGKSVEERMDSLERAVLELQRLIRPGGVFWSLSAICVESLRSERLGRAWKTWDSLVDGESVYVTADGYTSNNIDGTLMAWRKK